MGKNREAQLMDKRIKARAFSSKAQQARDRKALAEGNEFTFSFSADPENNDTQQGWGKQQVKLPKSLQSRCEELQGRFKQEPFQVRDAKAKARREQFYESVRAKARTFSGAPMGINAYSISFKKKSEDFGKTQAGWTDSQIVLPTALKARCNKLTSQFKPRPHAERQQTANTNRAQFMAERVAKGRAVSFKVDSAKAKRGMMQAEGFFSVNASDANDNDANAGWGCAPVCQNAWPCATTSFSSSSRRLRTQRERRKRTRGAKCSTMAWLPRHDQRARKV